MRLKLFEFAENKSFVKGRSWMRIICLHTTQLVGPLWETNNTTPSISTHITDIYELTPNYSYKMAVTDFFHVKL
jgi:hypothetical protein